MTELARSEREKRGWSLFPQNGGGKGVLVASWYAGEDGEKKGSVVVRRGSLVVRRNEDRREEMRQVRVRGVGHVGEEVCRSELVVRQLKTAGFVKLGNDERKNDEGGTNVKRKKKKDDSGKSIHVEEDSPIPPVLGPFESLASELKIVKDIVTNLSQGSGESSSRPVSYVPQSEFDAHFKDQKKQKAQLANLEKAYADLAKSHGELSISHSKMKKREKSREKFFTRMWKGVKGL
ncbi:hypothetical protein H5410_041555 [Solanum commersonii]|uniref:Uncharacterized protein n=1 Tax=Solanum commersonii TaxID=4109 RepID=A0A9J5XS71_SOLCO|nr:hypothetical protein H5410_041555 [Solanum commersonii]